MSKLVNKGIALERTYTKYVSYFWYFLFSIILFSGIRSLIYPNTTEKTPSQSRKTSMILIASSIVLIGIVYLNNKAVQKSNVYAGTMGVINAMNIASSVSSVI